MDAFTTSPPTPGQIVRARRRLWVAEDVVPSEFDGRREHYVALSSVEEDALDDRQKVMFDRNLGLTKTYNLFHNPDNVDDNIKRLRKLRVAMDRAVLEAYE